MKTFLNVKNKKYLTLFVPHTINQVVCLIYWPINTFSLIYKIAHLFYLNELKDWKCCASGRARLLQDSAETNGPSNNP